MSNSTTLLELILKAFCMMLLVESTCFVALWTRFRMNRLAMSMPKNAANANNKTMTDNGCSCDGNCVSRTMACTFIIGIGVVLGGLH